MRKVNNYYIKRRKRRLAQLRKRTKANETPLRREDSPEGFGANEGGLEVEEAVLLGRGRGRLWALLVDDLALLRAPRAQPQPRRQDEPQDYPERPQDPEHHREDKVPVLHADLQSRESFCYSSFLIWT